MFWGTYEDEGSVGQLEMSRSEIQGWYYDSPEIYQRLQDTKKLVDPEDVFHTSFTVQPKI